MKLKAENLTKTFKNRCVVESVTFEVLSGEVVGLIGPNGAGKTTSFYMVVGLLSPEKGKVFLDGEDITYVPMHVRAKRGMSYLPQNISIFRKLTVEENLLAVMEIAGISGQEKKFLLEDLLTKFSIRHIAKSKGISLSGGERRRVEIARALITKPKFLLLDEPFAGVDPVTVQEIQGIINKLKEENLGVLITDHNVRETLGICDRAYVLSNGRMMAHGDPKSIVESHIVKKNYLGENFQL